MPAGRESCHREARGCDTKARCSAATGDGGSRSRLELSLINSATCAAMHRPQSGNQHEPAGGRTARHSEQRATAERCVRCCETGAGGRDRTGEHEAVAGPVLLALAPRPFERCQSSGSYPRTPSSWTSRGVRLRANGLRPVRGGCARIMLLYTAVKPYVTVSALHPASSPRTARQSVPPS
jgi:hypothetical protein